MKPKVSKPILYFATIFVALSSIESIWLQPLNAQETSDSAADKAETLGERFEATHETIELHGFTLLVNRQLHADKPELAATMLELMDGQLDRVAKVVPAAALANLRTVTIWVNPAYEGATPTAEYHPNAGWLRDNGRLTEMAKCIEVTNTDKFEFENTRMPYVMLHELSHAYHDQVIGFRNTKIREAFDAAVAGGGYEEVDRFTGKETIKDKAYAMSNHKEYFAESTEAYFGKNDFYPFNLEELKKHDPKMVEVLKEAWGVEE